MARFAEMNLCPEEFQTYLTYLGGVNKYDLPNFTLWWNQYGYGEGSFISGGRWSIEESHFIGYRRLLRGDGTASWCLGQWHAPEEYGSPEAYYVQNFDEETALQLLGEYPYSGRVEVLYNLRYHEMIDDKLTLHSFPLETWILDMIVPIVIAAKDVSLEKRKAAYLNARQRDEDEKTAGIERHLQDKNIPFTGAVSFGRQGIRSTVIDQKALLLQREWANLQAAARKFRPGLQTR